MEDALISVAETRHISPEPQAALALYTPYLLGVMCMRVTSDSKSATWGHLLRSEAVATQLLGELQIAGKLLDAAIRNQKGERAERYFKLAQSAWLQVSSELQDEDPNEQRYPEVRSMLAALAEQLSEYSSCFNAPQLAND